MLSLKSVHSGIGKGEEGLTYPTVHTFEADHPTVAILQMRRAAYPTVHTQGRGRADLSHCAHFWGWASHCGHFTNEKSCQSHCGHTRARKGWPITLCTLLRLPQWYAQPQKCAQCDRQGRGRADLSHCAHFWGLSIPLWPFYKWEELPIPLWTHKGEEGLTYHTVHTFEAEHTTVAIVQMRRAAYPTVHTQGRGRADLSHCAHFWGWASHCGHFTNEKSCLSHCAHTRARKGWPIPLCTLLRLSIHSGHCTNEKRCLSHCAHISPFSPLCVHSGIGSSSHL